MNKRYTLSRFSGFIKALIVLLSLGFGLLFADDNPIQINMKAMDQNATKKVLVLNSYHQGHPWTDGVTRGLLREFSNSSLNLEIHIENMDTKRIVNKEFWYEILQNKLDSYPPDYLDLIISSDDNALYALNSIGHAYHTIPIVYCGISDDFPRQSDTCAMFVGVQEYLPFKENIELGLKLFPNTEHIAFVTDHSKTGISHYHTARQVVRKMDLDGIDCIWLNGYSHLNTIELKGKLSSLPENTIVIFSIWQVDEDGRFWDPLKYYPEFARITNAPIFTVTDLGVYDAFLGGMISRSETQGRLAADLGIRILNGDLIGNIGRIKDENIYCFNWRELTKWHIRKRDLPKGALIVNKPETVYSQYKAFFFITLSLIILMFVMFWMLLLYHFRYRNYEVQRTEMASRTKQLANRYNILFEQSNNAIVIFELEGGKVVTFNEKALKLFGTPKAHFQDYPLVNYFDNYNEMKDNIKTLLKSPFEMEMFTWERNTFYAQVILNLLEEKGTKYVYAIINDITGRKKQDEEIRISKARLNETLQNSKNSYWEWDIQNNVLHKDDNFWLALDINPKSLKTDPLDSNYYMNAVHLDDVEGFKAEVAAAVNGEKDTILHELRMTFSGKDTWVEIRGVIAKRDNKGRGLVINGFMTNISKRKKQEEELIKAKEKAEESDRLKSAFISNISHEIRTPLNGIVGFSNLLGRENLTLDDKRKYLSFINENNDLLLKLINDILEISKIETDSLNLQLESCNLLSLCENIVAQESIGLSPTIILSIVEAQSLNVHTDKTKLTQVLRNLISNAKKFTHEGTIEVGYRIDQDMLEFYIRDTGIGIDSSMHEAVFERFMQVDPFASGTGLGLPISKAIVEKMGGRIWLESALGKGTTAYFTIKYKKAKIKIHEIEPALSLDEEKKQPLKKVLIAEDDESSYVLLNVILTGKFQIIRAAREEEVLPHLVKYSPDILIADLDMPGFTEETIKSIRKNSKNISIVGISDNTLDFIRNKELANIIEDHLSKPINIKMLLEKIENQLS